MRTELENLIASVEDPDLKDKMEVALFMLEVYVRTDVSSAMSEAYVTGHNSAIKSNNK